MMKRGFTLVELLIYVGIFSLTATLFTGVLITLTRVQVRESATTEVSQQAQFVVQTVQRLVTDASIIELAANTATSTLKLRMVDASRDPTCVQLSGGVVYLMEGNDGLAKQTCFATSSPQAKPLTDSKVVVNTLNFTKLANPPAKDTVKIDLTVAYNSTNPQESLISRTLQTAITKISAATFDSDIVPATDNFHNVGLGAQQWAKGFFSNLLVGGYSSVTGGVAAFNGNVGVGTSAPSYALDVSGGLRAGNATSTNGIVFNPGTGNVGIGTTSPGYKLVVGPTEVNGLSTEVGTTPNAAVLRFGDQTGWKFHIGRAKESVGGALNTGTAGVLMTVQDNGNVGIGTTGPGAKLTVVDNGESTTLTTFTQAIANAGLLVQTEYTASAYTPGLFWVTSNNNPTKPKAGIWLLEDGSGTDMYFGTSNNYATGITNNGLVLDQSGNVGIGTTGPAYKLDVNGTGSFSGTVSVATPINPSDAATKSYVDNAVGSAGGLSGTGTATYVPYWTSGSNLSTSTIYYNSTTGNVGIGTTNPTQKLTIAGTGAVFGVDNTAYFQAKNSAGTYENYLYPRWSDNIMYLNYGSGGFNIRNNSSVSKMFMTDAGNVGIGTTAPQSTLDLGASTVGRSLVWGGSAGTAHFASIGTSYNSADLNMLSGLKLNTASDAYQYSYTGTYGVAGIELDYGAGDIHFFTEASAAHTAGNAFTPTDVVTIRSNGNVGIGTTSALARLHVSTAAMLSTVNSDASVGLFEGSGNAGITIAAGENSRANLYFGFPSDNFLHGILTYGTTAAAPNTGDMAIWVNNSERVRIDSTGSVGIMTTSPSYTLDVNGGFRAGNATSTNGIVFNPGTGNVGIGTTDAQQKLTVAGNIQAVNGLVVAAGFVNSGTTVGSFVAASGVNTIVTNCRPKYVHTNRASAGYGFPGWERWDWAGDGAIRVGSGILDAADISAIVSNGFQVTTGNHVTAGETWTYYVIC